MFKLEPNPTFEVRVAGFAPGRPTDGLFVTFRYLDQEAFTKWLQASVDRTVEDMLMDVIHGWRDAPLEFSIDALRSTQAKYPAFASALINTYREELFEAKRKN